MGGAIASGSGDFGHSLPLEAEAGRTAELGPLRIDARRAENGSRDGGEDLDGTGSCHCGDCGSKVRGGGADAAIWCILLTDAPAAKTC